MFDIARDAGAALESWSSPDPPIIRGCLGAVATSGCGPRLAGGRSAGRRLRVEFGAAYGGVRDASGQTTAEYTALLALVAAALAGAGAVVGLGAIAEAVASGVRTGICIVAGDVCRASDAAAAGLAPCTVAEHARGEGLTFTIASLRLGADDTWTAARRSDGSVIITHAEKRKVGGTVGIGVEASPLGVDVGVDGKLDYALGFGRAWEFADSAAAARFLRAEDREDREPTWRFGDAGAVLGGEASGGSAR